MSAFNRLALAQAVFLDMVELGVTGDEVSIAKLHGIATSLSRQMTEAGIIGSARIWLPTTERLVFKATHVSR